MTGQPEATPSEAPKFIAPPQPHFGEATPAVNTAEGESGLALWRIIGGATLTASGIASLFTANQLAVAVRERFIQFDLSLIPVTAGTALAGIYAIYRGVCIVRDGIGHDSEDQSR